MMRLERVKVEGGCDNFRVDAGDVHFGGSCFVLLLRNVDYLHADLCITFRCKYFIVVSFIVGFPLLLYDLAFPFACYHFSSFELLYFRLFIHISHVLLSFTLYSSPQSFSSLSIRRPAKKRRKTSENQEKL